MTADLWNRLRDRGVISDDRVLAALRDVPASLFAMAPLAPVLPLDAPVATAMEPPRAILPPPRLLAFLLQMLELEKRVSVLLLGSTGGYVEALLARLVEPSVVIVWEEDTALATRAQVALAASGFAERVSFVSRPPEDVRFDRVTTAGAIGQPDPIARGLIADMGFAAYRAHREVPQFVKLLRSGDEYVELATSEAATSVPAELAERPLTRMDAGRELLLGRMLENAWERREESGHDRHFAQVVDETFVRPENLPHLELSERMRYEVAKRLFHLAYIYQSSGEMDTATEVYQASLKVWPTAESHTFLGWVYSFEQRHEEAIAECEKAIAVDPSLGNPYNDIGAYLLELERLDEAIPWFEKAKHAARYCCYFYPFSNLGRVYMMKGMREKARREFQEALRINPEYEYAREMLRRVGQGADYFA